MIRVHSGRTVSKWGKVGEQTAMITAQISHSSAMSVPGWVAVETTAASCGDLAKNVDDQEAEEEHGAEEWGLLLFVGLDEKFFDGEVEQGGGAEREDGGEDFGAGVAEQGGTADRTDGCG